MAAQRRAPARDPLRGADVAGLHRRHRRAHREVAAALGVRGAVPRPRPLHRATDRAVGVCRGSPGRRAPRGGARPGECPRVVPAGRRRPPVPRRGRIDLAADGARIITPTACEVGDRIEIEFDVDQPAYHVEAVAEIVWRDQVFDGRWTYGMRFHQAQQGDPAPDRRACTARHGGSPSPVRGRARYAEMMMPPVRPRRR